MLTDSENAALTSAPLPALYSPLPPQPPPQAAFPIVNSPAINEETCRPATSNEAVQSWKENNSLQSRDQPLAQLPRPYPAALGSNVHEMQIPGIQRYWLPAVPGFQMPRAVAPNLMMEHNPPTHTETESSLSTQQGLISPALSLSTSQQPPSQAPGSFQVREKI